MHAQQACHLCGAVGAELPLRIFTEGGVPPQYSTDGWALSGPPMAATRPHWGHSNHTCVPGPCNVGRNAVRLMHDQFSQATLKAIILPCS